MADEDNATQDTATEDEAPSVETQAAEQTGQQQVRLRIDQAKMTTAYANAFRTSATAEEIMVDFGLNQVTQTRTGDQGNPGDPVGEILFQVNDRVIMNYYSAKRLAITLSQLIRRHEEQFGELEMDVAKRRKGE